MPIIIPFILIAAGITGLFIAASTSDDRPVPDHPPDVPQPPPGSTGYKLVDKILPQLTAASASSGVPLGLLVGWIAKESGGKIGEVTSYGERGLFQLMPDESAKLGLDHERLSTDLTYSINGGLALIAYYSGTVSRLGIAPAGTDFAWLMVKLVHSMGSGAVSKIIKAAQDAGSVSSWDLLEKYATAHDSELLHATKHSPLKWFTFVDSVYKIGKPFGFGTQITTQVAGDLIGDEGPVPGGPIFTDIPDPLDCLNS